MKRLAQNESNPHTTVPSNRFRTNFRLWQTWLPPAPISLSVVLTILPPLAMQARVFTSMATMISLGRIEARQAAGGLSGAPYHLGRASQ